MKKRKKFSINKSEILEVIKLDIEGKYQHEISEKTGIAASTVSGVLNYYRGKDNTTSKALYKGYKEIIDRIKNSSNEPIETVRVAPRTIKKKKTKTMTSKEFYLTGFCAFMLISTIIMARFTEQNKNTLERIETHYLNKVDSLIQNDIDREEMYDRWKENNNIGLRDFLK